MAAKYITAKCEGYLSRKKAIWYQHEQIEAIRYQIFAGGLLGTRDGRNSVTDA